MKKFRVLVYQAGSRKKPRRLIITELESPKVDLVEKFARMICKKVQAKGFFIQEKGLPIPGLTWKTVKEVSCA